MGSTTGDALRWPEYADPAAVPQDMQELATDVQTALNKRATVTALNTTNANLAATNAEVAKKRALIVPFSGFSRTNDTPFLTPDTPYPVTFDATYSQPANTTPAVSHTVSGWSRFNVISPGLHRFEFDVHMKNALGPTTSIEIGSTDGTTFVPNATFTVVKGGRLALHLTQNWTGAFYVYVKVLGSGNTGWQIAYARLALIGA